MLSRFPSHVPESVRSVLGVGEGRLFVGNTSGASVYRVEAADCGDCFLKVMHPTPATSLGIEAGMLHWLAGTLPVPEVLAFETVADGRPGGVVCDYMVTRALPGRSAVDVLDDEPLRAARLLAEGLKLIHAVPPDGCPMTYDLARRFDIAHRRVHERRYSAGDLTRKIESPEKRLARLQKYRPASEDLVFTHGDYALPNVLLGLSGVSGFVDLAYGGLADRHRDVALAVRSLEHNLSRRGASWLAIRKAVQGFYRWYGPDLIDKALVPYYQDLDELA